MTLIRVRASGRRGFTVIELMVALAILGALTAIALPTLQRLQLKAKTGEVKINLAGIRTAEALYFAEHGRYLSAAPTPAAWTPRSSPKTFVGGGLSSFDLLGFVPEGGVYFQYAVLVDSTNPLAYMADAVADIDGDAVVQVWGYSHPDRSGNVVPTGTLGCTGVVVRTLTSVTNMVGPCGYQFGATVF